MQVIRLEHPEDGLGPYRHLQASELSRKLTAADFDRDFDTYGCGSQPMHGAVVPLTHKYGFANREQAERWWDEHAREEAARRGYALAVYEVPLSAVLPGNAQVAFDPAVAKLICHIPAQEWVRGTLNITLAVEAVKCEQRMAAELRSGRSWTTSLQRQRNARTSLTAKHGSRSGARLCLNGASQNTRRQGL